MRLFAKWLVCFITLLVVSACFPTHFRILWGALTLIATATVLWASNLAIRPVLQLIALPVTLLTLGLFSFVVSGGVVALTDWLIPSISIHGFGICLLIAILVSVGNTFFVSHSRKRS
jgi:putative membrane protein